MKECGLIEEGSYAEGRGQKAEVRREATFKNMGLKQGHLVSRGTFRSPQIFLYALGFRPTTKVFINTSFLLPSALCPLPFFVKHKKGETRPTAYFDPKEIEAFKVMSI